MDAAQRARKSAASISGGSGAEVSRSAPEQCVSGCRKALLQRRRALPVRRGHFPAKFLILAAMRRRRSPSRVSTNEAAQRRFGAKCRRVRCCVCTRTRQYVTPGFGEDVAAVVRIAAADLAGDMAIEHQVARHQHAYRAQAGG